MEVLGHPLESNCKYLCDRLEDRVGYLEHGIGAVERLCEASGSAPQPVGQAVQACTFLLYSLIVVDMWL